MREAKRDRVNEGGGERERERETRAEIISLAVSVVQYTVHAPCTKENSPCLKKNKPICFFFFVFVMELPTSPPGDTYMSLSPFNATLPDTLLLGLPRGVGTNWTNGTNGNNATSVSVGRDTARVVIAVCITALYSLICVVGLLGNILVMYGVVR